jgi:superfamily II DNA or RNA helicase
VQAIIEAGTESVEWVAREFVGADLCDKRLDRRYFKPKFLLGLTATPERTDGADLLALCDDNLVYRCDVTEGIRQGLLCPFRYFGVPDTVDYRNIPSRNKNFDQDKLSEAVATQARAANALDQYRRRCGKRTIAFCVSQYHADFMADFFRGQGISAAAVHAGATSAPRSESLEALRDGSLAMLCAVDMFNEGVDLPELDTVMMLRPTESRIIWLQQFGRGLRRSDPHKQLTVIDYIGNHRSFILEPQALFGLPPGDREVLNLLERLEQGTANLPPGCEVT